MGTDAEGCGEELSCVGVAPGLFLDEGVAMVEQPKGKEVDGGCFPIPFKNMKGDPSLDGDYVKKEMAKMTPKLCLIYQEISFEVAG